MKQPVIERNCRIRALPWVWGLLSLQIACSAPLDVLDRQVDVPLARRQAASWQQAPDTAAAGHRMAAWLCLLHGEDCGQIAEHAKQVPYAAAEDALLRALALQGQHDVAARAQAWLDVLAVPAPEAVHTVAAQALARLAVRDRSAVVHVLQARHSVVRDALQAHDSFEQWRRWQALGPLLTQAAHASLPAVPAVQLDVQVYLPVISRRLHTGLLDLQVSAVDPPLVPTESGGQWLALPPLSQDVSTTQLGDLYPIPVRDPGICALKVQLHPPRPGAYTLVLQAPRGVRAWLGQQPLELQRDGSTRTWKSELMVGTDPAILHLAVAAASSSELLSIAVLPSQSRLSQGTPWAQTLADLVQALRDPDGPARGRLERAFTGPAAALVTLEVADPGTSASALSDAADRVLGLFPAHMEAQLTRIAQTRDAGNPTLALQMLRQLGPVLPAPPGPPELRIAVAESRSDLLMERAHVLLAVGLAEEAARVVRQAYAAQPNDCETFSLAMAVGQDSLDRALLRHLLQSPPSCPGQSLVLARGYAAIGQHALATAQLQRAMRQPSLARDAVRLLQENADALGEPAPAIPSWLQDASDPAWRAAQQAAGRHDHPAEHRYLSKILSDPGQSLTAKQRALQAGAPAPWQPFVRKGEEIAAKTDDPQLIQGASTAWLLDQELVVLLRGGGAIRRVHQVLRVLADEAAEGVGEVRVAEGADLEMARTLLPDGSTVLPAETADKDTISLRAVAAGTSVEFAQIAYVSADDPATGATRLPSFALQAADSPTVLSEYIVLVPQGVIPQWNVSATAPAAIRSELPGYTAYVFRNQNVPRGHNEPRAVRPETALPSVRVTAQADLQSILGPWAEALASAEQIRDADLDRWEAFARRQPPGTSRWQAVAQRIAQAIQQGPEGGPPGRPDQTLQNQKGDRAALLYALARRLGEDACLVRVLPLARTPAQKPEDPDDWAMQVVQIRPTQASAPTEPHKDTPTEPHKDTQKDPHSAQPTGAQLPDIWYDPGLENGIINHLRAGLRGRQGLQVGCKALNPHITLPRLGDGRDLRTITGDLTWNADGSVQGVVREVLSGSLAALLRTWLVGANEQTQAEVLQNLVGSSYSGLTVLWQEIHGLSGGSDDTPVTLAYTVQGTASKSRENALDLALYPEMLGQTYAGLHERSTALLFSHSLDLRVELRVHGPATQHLLAPAAVHVDHPLIHYDCESTVENSSVTLRKRATATPAVVEPSQYQGLAILLRQTDAADAVRLTRGP